MKKRIITNEVLQRVNRAEVIIKDWMIKNNQVCTTPEECFDNLVKAGIYNYSRNQKASEFREDLRNLRDNGKIDIFTEIKVHQTIPRSSWKITID